MLGGVDRRGGFGKDEKVRTHMMFSKSQQQQGVRRNRRKGKTTKQQLHQLMMMHDASSQTQVSVGAIDPTAWTGNQRVMHFGPLANRDQYYYYYPKGWDVLYPAHFGFFPFRTDKYRGTSPTVCLSAFGTFVCIGGSVMILVAYGVIPVAPPHTMRTLKYAGPTVAGIGVAMLLAGIFWWFCTLHLFSDRLRHTQAHHAPPRRRILQYHRLQENKKQTRDQRSPYHPPPPPVHAVLVNENGTDPSFASVRSEMKLYPPSLPGFQSSLTLPIAGSYYVGSPYNTLSTRYSNSGAAADANSLIYENFGVNSASPDYHAQRMTHYDQFDTIGGTGSKKKRRKLQPPLEP